MTISEETRELEKRIDSIHIERAWPFDNRIDSLRKRALVAHAVVEAGLEMIITDSLLELASPIGDIKKVKIDKSLREKWMIFLAIMASVFERMNLLQKLKTSFVTGKVNKHLVFHIEKMNHIRNTLVHTNSREYKKYQNPKEYLMALRHILASLNGISSVDLPYFDKLVS